MSAMSLVEKMLVIHERLDDTGLPHAFGGALALAWCTQQARGTIDLDLNVFVGPDQLDAVLGALPPNVAVSDADRRLLTRDGQARLWWDATPLDVFLNTTPFHEEVAERIRREPFGGVEMPFLGCDDLAVFKALFNRTKDWADLEAMNDAGTLDVRQVVGVLATFLGASDDRIERLLKLREPQ